MHNINSLLIGILLLVASGQIIQENPSSLLIPSGHIGTFTCKAVCVNFACLGYWIINNSSTQNQRVMSDLENKGFSFTHVQMINQNGYVLTMTVNATETVNNSEIQCKFLPSGDIDGRAISDPPANLIVLSGKNLYREIGISMLYYTE